MMINWRRRRRHVSRAWGGQDEEGRFAFGCGAAACGVHGVSGPRRIVGADELLARENRGSGPAGILESRLFSSAKVAASSGRSKDAQEAFLRDGFLLVYTRCNDFFYAAGRRKGITRASRAFLQPIAGLISGLLVLHDFGEDSDTGEDILKGLTLTSGFTSSVLNAYEEQFLFGEDNVESVRGLTLDALSVHAKGVLDKEPDRFDQSVRHLADNQGICTPTHILALVRKGITATQPIVLNPNGQAAPAVPPVAITDQTGNVKRQGNEARNPDLRLSVGVASPQ